ncbi:inositol monophosphatase family protein [Aliarcobacter butzleri]|uniref:Inositol monophosphatase n=1 Tax=Aliarcobacter butzleri TaxID=28197 RepID=A0AAW6VIK0_9BACT|nr:inositol monophosphatase family protein [Aliarcobacter butzleri]MDK2042483.1 inositol monophosphatase [Aliarcobacter butzleri]MDK2097578.1 inositol monophosphatase [Aliarcobacter butzleri]
MEITANYKKSFIKAVILANKEICTYIDEKITLNDYEYTNINGFGGDNSLKIDLIFEEIFIKHLLEFGNIYSEECGFIDNSKKTTIIIDPLDGSNNFYSQIPYYGTSVALKIDEKIVAGFVTNLITKTIIYKAFEDDVKYYSLINMKEFTPLKTNKSKIAIFERAYKYPKICEKLYQNNIKFRTLGAVALSLSNTIDYEFVLFAGNIREFDVEAALYICSNLYIYRTKDYLFITKYKEKYELFKEIINHF